MDIGRIELPVYAAEVITSRYLIRGGFQPIGPVLAYLNDPTRRYANFIDAALLPFSAEHPMERITRPQVMTRIADIVAVSLLGENGKQAAHLLVTSNPLIVYTACCVIQGMFHMGAEDTPSDYISSAGHDFIGVTQASLFPLQSLRHRPAARSELLLINRQHILFYHEPDQR